MAQKLIYAADDEHNIRFIIKSFLENEGYMVETFETGDALIDTFEKKPADLVILDIMMPGSDGFSICAKLRQKSSVPIIILSAKDKEIDYVTGIATGSDDYFTKPFSPVTLVMRVKAIFRRIEMENTPKSNNTSVCFGDILLNQSQKNALKDGIDLGLTISEFNMLAYLIEQKERAISRDELLNRLWGFESEIGTRAADDAVKRIRKKLTAVNSNVIIETVWGFGFRLKVEVT
jgi:DNA-binding response OmpR family regulator